MVPNSPTGPRVLGITLARGGSKGVPGKNIRPIRGHPLLAYTIAEARRARSLTRYVVSTDDGRIRDVAVRYGADAPFLRPSHLATDDAPSAPAIRHALDWVEREEGRSYDFVVELMATNPLKTAEDIDAAVAKIVSTGADSVVGTARLEHPHPARIKRIVDDQLVDFCVPEPRESRRQDLKPEAYVRNGSLYVMTRRLLVEHGCRYGVGVCRPHIMPPERSVNIDTPEEFLLVEALLRAYPTERLDALLSGATGAPLRTQGVLP